MTEILQCQYEYPDPYQQYSEPVFTPSQLCSQSLRFLQVHWNRAHTHQATQAHAHPQYVNQPTTSPEQLNPLQIYPRQLNPLPSHPKQSDRLQRHQEQLNPLYAHLEQSIDPRLLFQGTAPKDLVMPSSEPETLVREDITEISPTDEKRKLSGEEQNQHHNESEKTRRNLRRTILEEHLVPLLPQCESACNMAVVWESYRELALRELEKRDRLIAKLEGQGVDVEREFKVTKDRRKIRVSPPPGGSSKRVATVLGYATADLKETKLRQPKPEPATKRQTTKHQSTKRKPTKRQKKE